MRRSLLLALLAGSLAAAGPVSGASTVTFTANSTADDVDAKLGDGLCLTSAGDCSLRAAVQETNALGGGPHTISLLPGARYTLTRSGPVEDAAATGDLDIASNTTVTVSGGRAVVEGMGGWQDRIFHVLAGTTVALDRLDIRNGLGGIFNRGTLTVSNSTVSGNWDGGIANSGGTLTLVGSTVSGNSVANIGGGIFNNQGTLRVTNSTVSGNSAGSSGGGIYNVNAGTVTVMNSMVGANRAGGQAGGIGDGPGVTSGGTLTVVNSTVAGNTAGSDGGGILSQFADTVVVTNSTVSGNSAGHDGGGIYAGPQPSLTLSNSTVSTNSAARNGGGILILGTAGANSVTIAGNVADADADGAGDGGGVVNVSGGTFSLANTIVGDNVDASPTAKFPDCLGSVTSGGFNLLENATGCTIGGTGRDITGRDPLLGPLQDNGGPTFTHALLVKTGTVLGVTFQNPSPAIDGGGAVAGPLCLRSDQRGTTRPLDGNADGVARCDIGAYEYVPPVFKLGTWSLAPAEATARPGERITYTLTWTVPPPLGWRSLNTLQVRFIDDDGTTLWVRFQELAGAPGVFDLVYPGNGKDGPDFAPGSPNRLESEGATVYLGGTSVDGPPGQRVTLTLALSFKRHAARRVYDVLVLATDDAGEVQGFHRAGSVAVAGSNLG